MYVGGCICRGVCVHTRLCAYRYVYVMARKGYVLTGTVRSSSRAAQPAGEVVYHF